MQSGWHSGRPGLVSDRPGKLWKYMTGHLQKLQSPISKSYFDSIEYVKVPAFWSGIMNPHQLQHALASVSEKWVNRIGQALIPGISVRSSTSLSTQPFSARQNQSQTVQPVQLQSSVM